MDSWICPRYRLGHPDEIRTASPPLEVEVNRKHFTKHALIRGSILQTDDESHIFVGDTLFSLGCGRCLEGTPEELFASLQRIKALPQETRVHFGHEYTLRNFEFWSEMHRRYPSETKDIIELTLLRSLEQEVARDGFTHRRAPMLREELANNPFLKIKNATEFRRWRLERNTF